MKERKIYNQAKSFSNCSLYWVFSERMSPKLYSERLSCHLIFTLEIHLNREVHGLKTYLKPTGFFTSLLEVISLVGPCRWGNKGLAISQSPDSSWAAFPTPSCTSNPLRSFQKYSGAFSVDQRHRHSTESPMILAWWRAIAWCTQELSRTPSPLPKYFTKNLFIPAKSLVASLSQSSWPVSGFDLTVSKSLNLVKGWRISLPLRAN